MSIICPLLIPLARSLCPIPGNGACADPTTISAAAHSRPAPSPSALARARTAACGPHLLPFPASLLLYKKIASRNVQLGTIYIFRVQITTSTNKLTCKKA